MKALLLAVLAGLSLASSAPGQEVRFFRISGPVATTITRIDGDGYVTWTNKPINATFTVQVAANLAGPSNWVDYVQVPATAASTTERVYDPCPPTNMVLIPAGSFTMGDALGELNWECVAHTVYVSAFYMDKYEVTKAQWDGVYQWATNHGYTFDDAGSGKAGDHPAQRVNWYDCVKWCNARSEMEGTTPAYYVDAGLSVPYRTGQVDVENNWVNWTSGYRLPTEAEWEKAARGGVSGRRFPWALGDTISHEKANYNSWDGIAFDISSTRGYHPAFTNGVEPYTSPVGYFAPNGYGLYDVAGNVQEWCWDWYGAYPSGPQSNPLGYGFLGTGRVVRGGNWCWEAWSCEVAARAGATTDLVLDKVGFRVVLPQRQ